MLFNAGPGDLNKQNPSLKMIPEFAALNEKQMRTLIWYVDYQSPFRNKPKDDRFRLAALQGGYKIDNAKRVVLEVRARELFAGDVDKWNTALNKYMEMQHDEDREMIEMVESQIENIRSVIKTPTDDADELAKRTKLINSLPDLKKTKRELARTAGIEMEVMGADMTEEVSTRTLSQIDQLTMEENAAGTN